MRRRAGAGWLRNDRNHSAAQPITTDARALVVYASTHGHTAKIAARLPQAMRDEGLRSSCVTSRDAAAEPGGYDLVVVGGSLHKEHHQKALVGWASEHRDALAACRRCSSRSR